MKYLLVVCTEPISDPAGGPDDIDAWVTKHDASGARIFGDRLASVDQARTVRIRGGGTTVTDGPFAQAHASIAGIDILECASLDEAVAVALEHPMARGGALEVRPFYDWDAD